MLLVNCCNELYGAEKRSITWVRKRVGCLKLKFRNFSSFKNFGLINLAEIIKLVSEVTLMIFMKIMSIMALSLYIQIVSGHSYNTW